MEDSTLLLFLIIGYLTLRGFFGLMAPIEEPEKKKEAKCKECGVTIPAEEELCQYCEIIEVRKSKRDKKLKEKEKEAVKLF